jgi:hypothetical protein
VVNGDKPKGVATCTYVAKYLGSEGKDVSNEFHGELWRVDVRVPHHEFLEDVILNGTMKLLQLCSLVYSKGQRKLNIFTYIHM